MLITSIEELRLIDPNHAFDSIDGMMGFIDNSEHDFLEDKLGRPLYEALCLWYKAHPENRSSVADYQTGYWNRLLLMAQRCVGFDALGNASGMQGVSFNNSGMNVSIASDYPKADEKEKETYRKTAFTNAMKSCDIMLAELERWVSLAAAEPEATSQSLGAGETQLVDSDSSEGEDIDPAAELAEIVTLWRQSRYYYLAASMLIPSAVVLQQYLDFSESREKFIRMLPDLRFIQEEVIAGAIGEEYLDHLVDVSLQQAGNAQPITTKSPLELRIIHQLRRVMVAWLGSRTSVLKYTKEEKVAFHDDGVRKMEDAQRFIQQHQSDLLEAYASDADTLAAFKASPLYTEPAEAAPAPAAASPCCHQPSDISHQTSDRAACWTPPLL
jgi:hypothetical protein